jgi:hypothetical protein
MNRAAGALALFIIITIVIVTRGIAIAQQPGNSSQQNPPQVNNPVTELSADLGSCSVEFKVTDVAGHPLYNAKIKTQIRYGFMNKRKLDLEAGTNSDGRARFVKMPDQVKSPLVFEGRHDDLSALMTWDPGTDCHAQYPMLMGKSDK